MGKRSGKLLAVLATAFAAVAIAAPAASASVYSSWSIENDFATHPQTDANPMADSYGNPGVWLFDFASSSATPTDPASYSALGNFNANCAGLTGSATWGCGTTYAIAANRSSGAIQTSTSASLPAGAVGMYPASNTWDVLGWDSPIQGTVHVYGTIKAADTGADHARSWALLAADSTSATTATVLTSGVVSNSTTPSETFDIAPQGVSPGNVLFLVVGPGPGDDWTYDSTQVSLHIDAVNPACPTADSSTPTSCTFTTAGQESQFTVPAGVTSLDVTAVGAAGGWGYDTSGGGQGGSGASVEDPSVTVTPGQSLDVWVGSVGGDGTQGSYFASGGAGGIPGGGAGGTPGHNAIGGGGGGGYSGILNHSDSSPLVIAGGGGGGGTTLGITGGNGDTGSGGGSGTDTWRGATGGAGGSASSGGTGGSPNGAPGASLAGGNGGDATGAYTDYWSSGGGGGGGYYGGGGGGGANNNNYSDGAGGGGGSSYPQADLKNETTAGGPAEVIISWSTMQDQTITFNAPTGVSYGDVDFDPGATASSGLPVSYSTTTPDVCTIVSSQLHVVAAGQCTVDANQAGDSSYSAAPQVEQTFTIAQATMHVDANSASKTYGASDPTASDTLRSADLVNGDTSVAGLTGTASCSIGSHAADAGVYTGVITCAPGTLSSTDYSFVQGSSADLTINQATMHVDANAASKTYGASDPTATDTLRSTDLTNGDTSVAGLTGAASCSIGSHAADAGTYTGVITCGPGTLSSTDYTFVQGSAADLTINQATQSITFSSTPPASPVVGGTYTPVASATSGLTVVFSIDPLSTAGACSIAGGVVSFLAPGSCIVDADQAGNTDYQAAPTKQQTLTIGQPAGGGGGGGGGSNPTGTSTGLPSSSQNPSLAGAPVTFTVTLSPVPDGGTVNFTDPGVTLPGCGAVPVDTSTGQASCTDTFSTPGTYQIQADYSGDTAFAPSESAVITQVVQASGPTPLTHTTVTLASSANPAVTGQHLKLTATVSPVPDGGKLYFSDDGKWIKGCYGVTVNVTTGRASCPVAYGSPGSRAIQATYGGDAKFASSASSKLVQRTSLSAWLHGRPAVGTRGATFTVACAQHSGGCRITGLLSITQPANQARDGKRTVVIGEQAVTAPAGGLRSVTISLNAEGRRLLAKHKHLKAVLRVMLTAARLTSMIGTSQLMLSAPPSHTSRGH